MRLSYPSVTLDERDALIDFVVADTYPYNADPAPTREHVASIFDKGFYTETFWIMRDDTTRVGIVQYQDASPIHAEVHIRLHTPYRGQGIGTRAVAWLTDYLFHAFPVKHRVEGWTRADNTAMQKVFRRCGYVKEAHLRLDFPAGDGTFMDKAGYAILRNDWRMQTVTPGHWDDEGDAPTGRGTG